MLPSVRFSEVISGTLKPLRVALFFQSMLIVIHLALIICGQSAAQELHKASNSKSISFA